MGQTENGVVAFYNPLTKVTDLYQLSQDQEGTIQEMKWFKTLNYRVIVIIGRNDKLVCD